MMWWSCSREPYRGELTQRDQIETVITEVGPVEIDVPRHRVSSFEPKTVKKRQRRLAVSTR
jgi:putative transposase